MSTYILHIVSARPWHLMLSLTFTTMRRAEKNLRLVAETILLGIYHAGERQKNM